MTLRGGLGGWVRRTPKSCFPCQMETIVPCFTLLVLFLIAGKLLSTEMGAQLSNSGTLPGFLPHEDARQSNFSFDADLATNPDWMKHMPDNVSLAALSIPGTHDTLTHHLGESHPRLQCQSIDLETQLAAGIRYIDVRARLNVSRSSHRLNYRHEDDEVEEINPDFDDQNFNGVEEHLDVDDENWPGNLLIFHGSAYTGYTFTDVMNTVFNFLDNHPTEIIIMRLQKEGGPVHVGPGGERQRLRRRSSSPFPSEAPSDAAVKRALARRGKSWGADPDFEKSFNWYRHGNPRTSSGFARHFYNFPSQISEDDKRVPTVAQARGKVVLLQDFDGAKGTRNVYGLPWDESDPRLRIEDLWILTGPKDIDRKWHAVWDALRSAADEDKEGKEKSTERPLFLSHLSASVAVRPIEVAAGMVDSETKMWYEGINDRTGRWLEQRNKNRNFGKSGVLMADFPGKKLVDAIIQRNWYALGLQE